MNYNRRYRGWNTYSLSEKIVILEWERRILSALVLVVLCILAVTGYRNLLAKQEQMLKVQQDCMDTVMEMWNELDEVKADVEKVKAYSEIHHLTDEETTLIAGVVMAEAANQGFDGQAAVCEVIKNRAELWNMTITEVLTAPKQFAAPSKTKPTDSVMAAINAVFYEDYSVLGEVATHFHSGPEPYWTKNKELVAEIKDHKFWY